MQQTNGFELFGYILLGALVFSFLTIIVGMIDYKYHIWKVSKKTTESEAMAKLTNINRLLEINKGKCGEEIEDLLDEKTYWEDILIAIKNRQQRL